MSNKKLQVAWSDEVDSTSRLAREFLQAHPQDVHGFAAGRQTAGAGRLGRQWISVEGNLHLSVAIPGSIVADPLRPLLPFLVGAAVSRWLEARVQLRPTLKWPNDVVIDGCKVGGILCEATVQAGRVDGYVLGIGLNLVEAPSLPAETGYQAGSILQATGQRLPARSSAEQLAEIIYSDLLERSAEDVLRLFRQGSTASGQLWRDAERRWWRQDQIADTGALCLVSLMEQECVELVSSHHGFSWSAMMDAPLMVCDVGNSRVKLGLFRRQTQAMKLEDTVIWTPGDEIHPLLKRLNEWLHRGAVPVVHVVSVNDRHEQEFEAALKDSPVALRRLRPAQIRLISSCYDLSQMGADRMAALEAALNLRGHGECSGPMLVVSLGTATTIDLIDGAGVHLGGFIGVGCQTALEALHAKTHKLPALDLKRKQDERIVVPRGTRAAMQTAAMNMQVAWILHEASEHAKRMGVKTMDVSILLCGGFATEVANSIASLQDQQCRISNQKNQVRVMPDLVLLGAAVLATAHA